MDWKKICNKWLYPPVWAAVLLIICTSTSLFLIFWKGWQTYAISSIAYVIAAYTLTIVVFFFIKVFPGYYRRIKRKVYAHPLGNRYLTDVIFKTNVSLYRSLTINMLYAVVNLVSGFLYRSVWFLVLATYYSTLAIMRFLLVKYGRTHRIGEKRLLELRRSRICAVILLTVNLVLSGAVLMIIYQNRGYDYPGVLIYVMAAYIFYITYSAIKSMINYRKYQSPVISMAKIISLAASLVSMLSLETAMLAQFGQEDSELFRKVMIASTGGGISMVIVGMSLCVIILNTKEIRRLREVTFENS